MIYGRFLGSLIVFAISDLIVNGTHPAGIERYLWWVLVAFLATVTGLLISLYLGVQFAKDVVAAQDSLEYWEMLYPNDPELAKMTHKYWLEER